MPERQRSKLLKAAESEWPDLGHKYGKLGIPAVRAAVMAKNKPVARRDAESEDEARRQATESGPRRQGRR